VGESLPASCINDLPESDFRLKKAELSGQNDVWLKFTRGEVKPQQENSPIFTVGVLRQL
jgi:hypothetical protein